MEQAITVERVYNAGIDKVWKAISDKAEMKKWYFDVQDFLLKVGAEFHFHGTGSKGEKYLHCCKILEITPGKKFRHTWAYDGLEGASTVTFSLSAEGDKTKIKLTHEGVESMAANGPNFTKENFTEGWTMIIGNSLKNFVEA